MVLNTLVVNVTIDSQVAEICCPTSNLYMMVSNILVINVIIKQLGKNIY